MRVIGIDAVADAFEIVSARSKSAVLCLQGQSDRWLSVRMDCRQDFRQVGQALDSRLSQEAGQALDSRLSHEAPVAMESISHSTSQ